MFGFLAHNGANDKGTNNELKMFATVLKLAGANLYCLEEKERIWIYEWLQICSEELINSGAVDLNSNNSKTTKTNGSKPNNDNYGNNKSKCEEA